MRYAKEICRIARRCGGCGKTQEFVSSGRFRVNANGKRLDVWLIYRCKKCGHTLNIPIYERALRETISPELLQGFWDNDPGLAERFARDRGFFKSKGYRLVK